MRQRIILTLLALLLVALPDSAYGQRAGPINTSTEVTGGLETAATLAASRTLTIDNNELRGYGVLSLFVTIYDADDGEDQVNVSCTFEATHGGSSYNVPICEWDAVNKRHSCEPHSSRPARWDPSDETTIDYKRMVFRFDIEGADNGKCTFAFNTGSASDTIAVVNYVAVK